MTATSSSHFPTASSSLAYKAAPSMMLLPSNPPLFLSLLTAISPAFTSGALLPLNPPNPPNLPPAPAIPPSNLTTTTTRCTIHPFPPHDPVSLTTCHPTFTTLLAAPDVDIPRKYTRWKGKPVQLTGAPCAISVDSAVSGNKLRISKRHLVERVSGILGECAAFGQGGWAGIEGSEGWIVIVQGVGDAVVVGG